MQKIEYNHIKKLFPFIFSSKFLLTTFNEHPYIKSFDVALQLNNKQKPEVLFWILFSLNNKKTYLNYFHKKKYINGKSIFTKSFLKISKRFGEKKKIIYNINKIYQNILVFSKEVSFMKSFPLKEDYFFKAFKFYDIKFEEKYNGLINLSPKNWLNYNLKFLMRPVYTNGNHFRFFLQNLQLPIV